jgi:hypothetical protein
LNNIEVSDYQTPAYFDLSSLAAVPEANKINLLSLQANVLDEILKAK